MEAKEVRLGNYVSVFTGNQLAIDKCMVNSIDSEGINAYHKDGFEEEDYTEGGIWQDVYGIPLTEELLLKFGFKYYYAKNPDNGREFHTYYLTNDIFGHATIQWDYNDKYCYLDFEGCMNSQKIKCVHTLQNLIFALTGEELTYAN